MAITLEEIKSKIDFPDIYLRSYLYPESPDVSMPRFNFTDDEKGKIYSAFELLLKSPTAEAMFSEFFASGRILNIMPTTEGSVVVDLIKLGAAPVLFLDLKDIGLNFLTLSGGISSESLPTILFHEFTHVSDLVFGINRPTVEITGHNYNDPAFDHLGSSVTRTNIVRDELNKSGASYEGAIFSEGLQGEYRHIPSPEKDPDLSILKYLLGIGPYTIGQYDQAILFQAEEKIFTSVDRSIDGHPSKDLVISLQYDNGSNIWTGAGDDVVIGHNGSDFIYAGDNDDKIYGAAGEDHLYGEKGIDRLWGDAGNDRLYGGEDNDFLFGGTEDDIYHIARFGSGIDTITDEDGRGLIFLGEDDLSPAIIGTAIPVSGGVDGKQLYEIESNHIKLEYDSALKILNIYDWDGRSSTDKIIINDFDSGELHISLVATTTTLPPISPLPKPKPVLPPPEPDTDGSSETLLSVQAVNQTIDVGTKIPLLDLFPMSGWVDNDGVNDIVSFAVADRTSGGGFLEVRGDQAIAGIVYEFPIYDIVNLYFVAGPDAAVDDIGFNIIQTNGDYSPRLEPGAIVTTVVPTEPAPKPPGAHTGGGSNLATLSFSSTSTGASSGGSVEVTYTVKNIGDKISAKGKADIVLANTPDLLSGRRVGDDFSIPELKPGEERTYTRIVDVPISGNGNYFLGVDVRSVSLGHNLIESDDTASIPFQIGPGLSGNPDLHPGFSDPKKIFTQDTVETIDFTISTNANGSPPYDYRVLLSRDDAASSDDVVLIDKTSGGLGYIGTHYYNTGITIPNYIPDGLYHLIVAADPFAKIFETNETNNTRARQIVVVSRPADANELSNIVGSHVVVETDIMEVLQSYNIESYGFMDSIDDAVKFPEHESLLPVEVMLYLSEDNIFDASDIPFKGGTELIEAPIGQILGNSTTFPIPQWIDSGDYYLFAVFDPDNLIAEDIESDNVTSGTNVTIVNNLERTVTAGNDVINLVEGNTLSVDILSNDTTSIAQEMIVLRFEGDYVDSSAPFIGQTEGGLGYSISRDGILNLDASNLNFDLMPGEVRTETFRYELRAMSDDTSDLGIVTISIRDPDTIQISPNEATVSEARGKLEFTITRSDGKLSTEETVYVSTTQGHGNNNNSDYTSLLNQPYTFSVGEATKVIPVNILSDSVTESDETFGLIVQASPTDPVSTFLASTTFTIHEDLLKSSVTPNTRLFPGHTLGEFENSVAFAALKEDGSVVTWGGLDSSSVASQLFNVTQIYSNSFAFAALKEDGSVVTWGGFTGGDSSSVASDLVNVAQIYSNSFAFAALKEDGSVVTWGDSSSGSDSSSVVSNLVNVMQIYSTFRAFAALKEDGSVVTWGDSSLGGDSSIVASKLVDVTQIYSTGNAFAALKEDGSVVTWGNAGGGDSSSVASKLVNVTQIYSTSTAFAALRADGSVITWGMAGGNSSSVASNLVNVTQIYSTSETFAALKEDGSVVTWGNSFYGGDSSIVASELVDVTQIYSTSRAFAALKEDGSVVTWGDSFSGGDSTSVASNLVNVTQIYSTGSAFAALRADGSVVTWGNSSYGGDSSSVASNLVHVTQIYSTSGAFSALKEDGSVVTWGDSSYGGNSFNVADQLSSGVVDLSNIYTDVDVKTSASGNSILILDSSEDNVILTGYNNLIWGSPDTINGTNIENFGSTDTLFISGVELEQGDLSVTKGSAILSLDTDDDDRGDIVIRLAGDFRLESFIVAGASSSGSYILYLGNAVPVGVNDNITTMPEGFATDEDSVFTTANVLANDMDGDGDALFVTALDITGTLGQVINNGDGTFNYDPNGAFEHLKAGETETDSFVYTVSDGNGGEDTATVAITINGVNDISTSSPTGQLADGEEDKIYNIFEDDLLTGSSGADGDTLNVSSLTITNGVLGAFNSSTNSWPFMPTQDYNGIVNLTYDITDNNGESLTGITRTFNLSPVNDTPQAGDDYGTVNEDSSITASFDDLMVNDIDVDGTSKTIVGIDTTGTVGSVVIDTVHRTITYSADADAFDLLATGATANDSFKYTLQGSSGETSVATVFMSVVGIADGVDLFGTVRSETLNGTTGDDRIRGNDGNDILKGGDGNDWLAGERGSDTLFGGLGKDVFFFSKGASGDTISDFVNGIDKIQIAADTGITDFSQLKISGSAGGKGFVYTTFSLGHDGQVVLNGIPTSALDATDFIFSA